METTQMMKTNSLTQHKISRQKNLIKSNHPILNHSHSTHPSIFPPQFSVIGAHFPLKYLKKTIFFVGIFMKKKKRKIEIGKSPAIDRWFQILGKFFFFLGVLIN
jgi:hypothetical protein